MHTDLAMKAKETLGAFVPKINVRLSNYFDSELEKNFGFNEKQKLWVRDMLEHCKEFLLRKQKKLRPSFVLYSYKLGKKIIDERIWMAALGTDLVADAAILMHDDFMDRDELRRGNLSTHYYYGKKFKNEHLGDSMAVNAGDAMLCLGFELVSKSENMAALRQLLRGIANTAYGQAYDMSLEAFGKWNEQDIICLHKAKTAIYTYENPLFIGAHLANLPKEAFDILHDYAMDGGVAFQLQDDILGVFGTPEKTGKSADSDLLQGKCTMLVLKVFSDGTNAQQNAVKKVWGKIGASRKDLDVAKQAIIDSGSLQHSNALARRYAMKAAKIASKLRDLSLNPEAIDYIQGIAEYMVNRDV